MSMVRRRLDAMGLNQPLLAGGVCFALLGAGEEVKRNEPAIDGENATDDLNALRLIEKEHKDGTFEKKLQEISAKLAGIG